MDLPYHSYRVLIPLSTWFDDSGMSVPRGSHSIVAVLGWPTRAWGCPMATDAGSNVSQNLSVFYEMSGGGISVDATGMFLVMGGRKFLFLINLEVPWEHMKAIHTQGNWELGVVEYNPHPPHATVVAAASNKEVLLFDLADDIQPLQATMRMHTRAISDLDWNHVDTNLLASCSADTYIHLWDIRTPRQAAQSFCAWTAGASQVKWNRHSGHTLASAHEGEIRIWDIRKESSTVAFITAHSTKIYGIDWSPNDEFELASCGHDKLLKFWNVTSRRNSKSTIQTAYPVLKVKYTPFGNGVVSTAQRADNVVRLWNAVDGSPVHAFSGHTEPVRSLDWRVRTQDGVEDFQLISLGKDRYLRMWHVDAAHLEACGYVDSVAQQQQPPSPVGSATSTPPVTPPVIQRPQRRIQAHELPMSLEQEFTAAATIPQVIVKQSDPTNRSCTILFRSDVSQLAAHFVVTFPKMYPRGAPPSMEFLSGTNIPTETKRHIKQVFNDTSFSLVEQNKPCLGACLQRMLTHYGVAMDMDQAAASATATQVVIPSQSTPTADSASSLSGFLFRKGRLDDGSIPCPRLTSASFNPSGLLVSFANFPGSTLFLDPGAPRTYAEFQTQQNKQRGNPEILGFFSAQPQVSSGRPSLAQFLGKQMLKEPAHGSENVTPRILVHDVTHLTHLVRTLGSTYTLLGADAMSICLANASAAKAVGRHDLVKTWTVAAQVVDPALFRHTSKTSSTLQSWSSHPFGRSLMAMILDHYVQLCDIQTVATLSCVLALASLEACGHHQESQSTRRWKPQKGAPLLLQPWSGVTRRSSINRQPPTVEGESPVKPDVSEFIEGHRMQHLAAYRRAYADVLYNWGLLIPRVEILKYTQSIYAPRANGKHGEQFVVDPDNPSAESCIRMELTCYRCNRLAYGPVCQGCRMLAFRCAICHLGVRGESSFCLHCGHGGHLAHMHAWFLTQSTCPVGCGCRCKTSNAFILL